MTNAKEQALKILNDNMIGTMATVQQNKPHSRYMTFFNDDFILYTATSKKTHKVEDIEQNPYTHILLGYDGNGLGDSFLEIEGKVEVSDDESMKEKVWNDALKGWFEGPEDPDLVILKIVPTQVRVMNSKGKEPEVVKF
ncbi:pyridoxamine 5'-phosphate oxidase family protein [Psychrobacillus sp. FSL K6-2684]|uniref:Pyridoxamine 5'-phosphate oxidase family protein n=1 Tax=Psychrobacillus faecigallinarum TaxID=2762235 RepID=A0ABR8R8Q8_9BACI|nr:MULTISPECIES: pyridoxamine 5'-phosphate oxidase family protein [Psychrobacillus]MBD7944175.1 pyridoxamine 5'-phosphate oxidase family protein [Psychrobacillus faecigallinarum]QEY21042.1 general stress protein [Psychrobacillus sp. AK 1817]